MPLPLPRPGPTDELDDPGYELDLLLGQYADEIEAAHAALPGKLGATPAEIGAAIAGAAAKATPADADSLALEDAGTLKRISWESVRKALNTDLRGMLGGAIGLSTRARTARGSRAPMQVFPGSASSPLSQVTGLTGSPALTYETGPNGMPALKIVTGAGTTTEISFSQLLGCTFDGDLYVAYDSGYNAGMSGMSLYITPDASYGTNYALISLGSTFAANPLNSWREQGGACLAKFSRPSASITGSISWPFTVGAAKLRITPVAATVATVYIYAVGVASKPAKGRCFVVADDGYESWFRIGAVECAIRGIPSTASIIPQLVGGASGNYATLDQLRAYLSHGNACVAHGPTGDAASNLITLYPGSPSDQVADAEVARDFILDNGLYVPGCDACYIWPQGVFQSATGDASTLDAFIAAGFTVGRSSSAANKLIYTNADAMPRYPRLCAPNANHSWAGSTASQVANVTNVTDIINNAAAAGSDCWVTFHEIVATSTADGSMSTTKCRVGDLRTILDAIKTKMDAGTLECLTLPSLAVEAGNFWSAV